MTHDYWLEPPEDDECGACGETVCDCAEADEDDRRYHEWKDDMNERGDR